MGAGELTSEQLVRFYLDRIARYDAVTNAVLHVNPSAAAEARARDEDRRRGRTRGPLHGVPILLKDNFDTKDMPTTGGALALAGMIPKRDAFQVQRLREAGAIILGKVNLHELALGLTTVSSLGGQTHDPYDVTRAPGGSSGGSAVAATMNFAAATLGTDTSGSIRIPSAHNNVVGLRPSLGLSSRAGIIPFGHTQDTGGPIARSVEDVATLLDATVGFDPNDPSTAAGKNRIPKTYTAFLKRDALNGARIGILPELFGTAPEDSEVGDVVRRALEEMKAHGASLTEVTVPNLAEQLQASNLLMQELRFYLGDYLKTSGAPVSSIEELLETGLHAYQLQGFLEAANAIPGDYLASDDYKRRLAARDELGAAVVAVMDANRVDALAYPVTRRIAPVIGGNQIGSNAGLSAQTGFPAISVPAGFTAAGFPVGVEMLGRRFAEATLIALAYSFEQSARHRRPPPVPAAPETEVRRNSGEPLIVDVIATGAKSVPPSDVPFSIAARFTWRPDSHELTYAVTVPEGSLSRIIGVYLHRRVNRTNGGVAYILAKSPLSSRVSGSLTLSDAEATDLKAGKFYVSAVSRTSPRLSARADLAVDKLQP